jgi:hypothetical protein
MMLTLFNKTPNLFTFHTKKFTGANKIISNLVILFGFSIALSILDITSLTFQASDIASHEPSKFGMVSVAALVDFSAAQ